MDFFKCLAVLHLVVLSAPFIVSMQNEGDHMSKLPKPVITLIAQELTLSKDLGNFACANKKINASAKPELSQRLSQVKGKLAEEFLTLCVDNNLESQDLNPIVRMAQICTFFNKNQRQKEDYEFLNEKVLYFIQKAMTRQIKNCRQSAIDSLIRLIKNGYDEAIIYAKGCVAKWQKAKSLDFVENRNKLSGVLQSGGYLKQVAQNKKSINQKNR